MTDLTDQDWDDLDAAIMRRPVLRHYEVVTAEKECVLCMAAPGETCRVQRDGAWVPSPPWMKSIHVERSRDR